jgi:hypothetical protein
MANAGRGIEYNLAGLPVLMQCFDLKTCIKEKAGAFASA